MHWRRKWQPTPVFLPGESQGRGNLVGCRLWGRTESDTTEAMQQQQQQRLLRPLPAVLLGSWLLFSSYLSHLCFRCGLCCCCSSTWVCVLCSRRAFSSFTILLFTCTCCCHTRVASQHRDRSTRRSTGHGSVARAIGGLARPGDASLHPSPGGPASP